MGFGDLVNNDAEMELIPDESGLALAANFFPPHNDGKHLTFSRVQEILASRNITFGVDWELVNELLVECNLAHRKIKDKVIAKGTHPVEEIPDHIILEAKFLPKKQLTDLDVLKVDYRSLSSMIVVHKGEFIAHAIEKVRGIAGKSIYGEEIPFGKKEVENYTPGEGVELVNGTYLALCDGLFELEGNVFAVTPNLLIKGNVDYHTGHIVFPGNILLEGEIKDGFHIFSGGSLACKKTVDASEILCKTDFIAAEGVIGKGDSLVRAGGIIKAKFVENCRLEAIGSITVLNSIVYSHAMTLSDLHMSDKGRLVGGYVQALGDIVVHEIGNKHGVVTEIQCGSHFLNEKKMKKLQTRVQELRIKLQQLNELSDNENEARLSSARKTLLGMIDIHDQQISDLLTKIDEREDSTVTVTGTAYPGTIISICHNTYVVEKEESGMIYSLNKKKGGVSATPISG